LRDFWFEPAPATRLALLRICVGAFILWYLWPERGNFIRVAQFDPRLFAPMGIVFHGPIPVELFTWLFDATLLLAIVFTFGLWHRVTGPLFAGLFLWLMCYRHSWSMIYHSDNMVVLHVIVLSVSRAADALSLDALIRSRRNPGVSRADRVSWEYNWPVKLMCALVVSAYFVTAVAKLSGPMGVEWMTGGNLRSQMAVDAIRKELLGEAPNRVSHALYGMLPLFSVLSVGSLCLELLAPLALLNRRVGWFWAANTFMMHWGIFFVMHITFHYHLTGMIFLAFFPVERVLVPWHRLSTAMEGRKMAPAPIGGPAPQAEVHRATLYYDGECGLCDRFVQFVLKHDPSEYFQFATLQSAAGRELLAGLNASDAGLVTMVMVESNEPYTRSTAALRICRRLAAPWPLLYAFMLVPRPWRDGAYSFVASRRKRWFRSPEACAVMPPELRRRFLS
jgi:predicted DCC family thiol-disulfide oxidoreductase YuxK